MINCVKAEMHNRYLSQLNPILPFAYTITTASITVCHFHSLIFSLCLTFVVYNYISCSFCFESAVFHVCDPSLLFSYTWKLVGNIAFVYVSNPDLVRYNYQQALVVYFVFR